MEQRNVAISDEALPVLSNRSDDLDLDAKYGPALAAFRQVEPLEEKHKPNSLQKLDADSAQYLRELIKTSSGLRITRFLFHRLPILWIMDEAGDIWIAFEEVIDMHSNALAMPKVPNSNYDRQKYQRLGHPSLVAAGKARMAGEIKCDPRGTPPDWYISNASGRYGIGPQRTETHLENIAAKFRGFGIDLMCDYIPAAERLNGN